MANIFEDIGKTIGSPIGGLARGISRGLAPTAWEQGKLQKKQAELMQKLQMLQQMPQGSDAQRKLAKGIMEQYQPEIAAMIGRGGYQAPQQGQADPFTLGPGQQRFSPTGQPIADVPPTPAEPSPFTLGPGQQRFGAGGDLLADVPPAQTGFTLAPGGQRFGPTGQQIAGVPPTKAFKAIGTGETTSVIDPATGQIMPSLDPATGKPFPSARVPSTSLTVHTGSVEKATKTQLEKDIIDLQSTLGELGAIEKGFNEDFFTYKGKAKAYFTALAEKTGISIGQTATKFLREKTKFFADAKRVFLKFRKFITGVAGGIEEFKEIAKATIDPESDSATQFQAKFDSMRDNAIRVSNLLMAIRNSGLDASDKSVVKTALNLIPLERVPLQVSPSTTLESLTRQQPETKAPETKADIYKSAISKAREQLGANATDAAILDLAEELILGTKK